ncbi:MAG: HEPN domain-containing protein [Thermoprotei archaeon]|nr:HEPN domain-containing protein [Thermoprotei archaeon]
MSIDPIEEAYYRYRLAIQHLNRAKRLYELNDWVGTVQFAQIAIENFAKTLIALFEIPTWSHDPSNQLIRLLNRFPDKITVHIRELAEITRSVAPEHGRSTYGEPSRGLTPNEIYTKDEAKGILEKAQRAKDIVELVLNALNISLH